MGKREAFSTLLGTLFPHARETTLLQRGSETSLNILNSAGEAKRGSADAVFGNAVIEFERDLKKTGEHALDQLREYVAGMWQRRGTAFSVAAVATDGIHWEIFYPLLPLGAAITPEAVALGEPRRITLNDGTLGDFYRWLNQFLFRPLNLEPTSEAIREDFGAHAALCELALAGLRRAWVSVRDEPEAQLARETWQRSLTITYGKLSETDRVRRDAGTGVEISEVDELYLRHTWLVSMSRLMVWASLSHGSTMAEPLSTVARKVFDGQYFRGQKLGNLTDHDFFYWILRPAAQRLLAGVWEQVLTALLSYDLRLIREDVLKGVYHELVDPRDRHDLGEYYTPDWLCERTVAELLPKQGFAKVLDPSCGSGSFLRAAIHHFLESNPGSGPEQLQGVLESVQGIDIHPVAVTIAKATYVLALGKLATAAARPVQIPVYLADALFLPRDIEQTLIEKLSGKDISFGPRGLRKRFVLPDVLVQRPEAFDAAIAAATEIAESHATGGKETVRSLRAALQRTVPWLTGKPEAAVIEEALWGFVEGLAELIRQKQNSIWSFVIRNSYRPAMLQGQFDFIIGNPPWVAYRYVTDPEYQVEIKRLAVEKYGIAPKQQKLFTQMELATVFLAHAMETFAKRDTGRLAFVMPRSVLSADQHQNLITGQHRARFHLTGYWDLWDVAPLFNVPCCVLFAEWSLRPGGSKPASLPVLTWHGTLKGRDARWAAVKDKLTATAETGRVVRLGTRSALSTGAGSTKHGKASPYAKAFKQGATLVPRNLWFVESRDTLDHTRDGVTQVKTSEAVARDSKPPYQDVRMEGLVENCFLFSTTLAANILPFALRPPLPVVLPVEEVHGQYHMRDVEYLREHGYRRMMQWLEQAETIWAEKRGVKADRSTVLAYLDYQGKLTAQNPKHRHLVLFNATGTNIASTYVNRRAEQKLPLIIDHKCYRAAFGSEQEAHFISAVLNSEVLNKIIKPFQSTGLLGERDIHKKALEAPIPLFDPAEPLHRQLAELGVQCHRAAQAVVDAGELTHARSLARSRKQMRDLLQAELTEIDTCVERLLR